MILKRKVTFETTVEHTQTIVSMGTPVITSPQRHVKLLSHLLRESNRLTANSNFSKL